MNRSVVYPAGRSGTRITRHGAIRRTRARLRCRSTRLLDGFARRLCLTLPLLIWACDLLPHPGDTDGVQRAAKWYANARIVVDTDPRYTIVRLRADTAVPDGHDVLVARFDFDPAPGVGDEYSIGLALDFGRARDLRTETAYALGPPPRSAEHTSELQSRPHLVCR